MMNYMEINVALSVGGRGCYSAKEAEDDSVLPDPIL